MNTTTLDVERVDGRFTDAKLKKAIGGKDASLSSDAAFRLYFKKQRRDESTLLKSVIANTQLPYKTKMLAIQELGRAGTKTAQNALMENLKEDDPRVLSKTARTLGQIGDKAALEKLKTLNLRKTNFAYEQVEFAKKLIAYRKRINDTRFTAPSSNRIIPLNARKTTQIETGTARIRHPETLLAETQKHVAGLALTFDGAAEIHCRDDQFLLTFNQDFNDRRQLQSMKEGNALPLVLLRKRHCPDHYYVNHYFFTHPSRRGNFLTLIGARPGGTLTYFGQAKVEEDHFSFSFQAVQNRYVAGLQMEGRYDFDARQFSFSRAESNIDIDREKNPLQIPKEAPEL